MSPLASNVTLPRLLARTEAYLDGGAATSGPGVKTLDILIVVVDPKTLFDKLGHSGAGGASGGSVGGGSGGGGRGGGGGGAFPGLGRFVDDIRYVGGRGWIVFEDLFELHA